jgi:Protein of unknown function (DUF1194)
MAKLAWVGRALSLLFLIDAPLQAAAQSESVDLELVLAVDVSRSMDFEEQELQRDGYAAAFRHPEVLAAIASGPLGRIGVTYVEWAGPGVHTILVPWTIVAGHEDAFSFADKIAAAEILRERGTSISSGLDFASGLFAGNGIEGLRRAIDVSGDGPNNMGLPVALVRDQVVAAGITINGLPIMLRPGGGFGAYGIRELDIYYEDCVIGGPGAFIVTVDDAAQFPAAIRRKLVLEIAGRVPPPRFIPAAAMMPRIDCLIGEKRRERYLFDRY